MDEHATNLIAACSQAGIAPYQAEALLELSSRTHLKGKRVLEIGGSNLPRALVLGFIGAKQWVSVDIIDQGRYQIEQQSGHYENEGIFNLGNAAALIGKKDYLIINSAIESATILPDNYFDVVLSITSFEHILAIPLAISQIKRVMTSKGYFFTYHGPLWSGRQGHHIWVDEELNFIDPTIPDFAHLLHNPPEMFEIFKQRFGAKRAQTAVLQMYHEPRINRLFYEDYIHYFRISELSNVNIVPYAVSEISPELQARLEALHPRYKIFDAYGMMIHSQ